MKGMIIQKSSPLTMTISRPQAGGVWLSGLIGALVLLLEWLPNSLENLCFDYEAILAGEYWRLLTGHFVHSSFSHLFWDLLIFMPVSVFLERVSRRLFVVTLLVSMTFINLFLLSPYSQLAAYSGLSGVLYAVMLVAALHWRTKEAGLWGWMPLILLAGKTLLELGQHDPLIVSTEWALYGPAHLLGGLSGMAVWAGWKWVQGTRNKAL